ncbi:hypothetical protein SAMN05421664_1496 [Chryseobacterium soldanellicola]|uniref:Uncharacterized protein n=1 Tax=Chryseobacterium soldanellicola TaxID=311333 RepID=A0A1H1AMC2_9FLAO|nr:hypothetical protein [Chryseobacterium soldanellicola]SDQ40883.1 hypothetical protein SAMN05421664_1496 [Chryseobacterium soldanellicola]
MKNNFFYVLFLLIFIQCSSNKFNKDNNLLKLVDLFTQTEEINTDKQVLLIRFSKFSNESNYLVELTAFDPQMYLGLNNTEKDLGTYQYKNLNLSFTAEGNIDTKSLLEKLKQVSTTGFINKNGIIMDYDPVTWKFYVDKNFNYVAPFHSTSDQITWDKKVRNYLKSK